MASPSRVAGLVPRRRCWSGQRGDHFTSRRSSPPTQTLSLCRSGWPEPLQHSPPRSVPRAGHHKPAVHNPRPLQEVNRFPFFEEALRRAGYEGVFFAKLHSPCEGLGFPADGCALFWRVALLEAAAPADAAPYVGAGGAALNQGRLIQLLRERATGDLLLAATTHLKAKEDSEGVRALEAAQLVAALRSAGGEGAAGRLGGVPIVLCGDFNDSPGSRAARRPSSSVATLPA